MSLSGIPLQHKPEWHTGTEMNPVVGAMAVGIFFSAVVLAILLRRGRRGSMVLRHKGRSVDSRKFLRHSSIGSNLAPISFSEFLSGWCELTWPKVAEAASVTISEKLESALEEALRKYPSVRGETTYSVKFGTAAPEILEVYSYQKLAGVEDGALVCGHMRWDAQLDIELCIGPAKIGIDRMLLEGVGCMVAQPLMPSVPVLGGFQVFFCNPPELSFNFRGLGGVTALSLVDNILTKVMHEAFSNMMVLPNRLVVRFANTRIKDYAEFKSPPPKGFLRVHLIEASNLTGVDFRLFSDRTSDPYCVISMGGQDWHSKTIMKDCNPKWGGKEDSKDFLVYHEQQALQLSVYDAVLLGGDAFLGSLPPDLTVHDLLVEQRDQEDGEVQLELDTSSVRGHTSLSEGSGSKVHLMLEYFEFAAPLQQAHLEYWAPALLSVKVYHMSGMPAEVAKDIRIRVRCGSAEHLTKKSKGMHVKDLLGFGSRQCEIMCSLAQDGVSNKTIARAYDLTDDIVEEVILAKGGKFSRFGWDETIHLLADDLTAALASVEICLQDKWFALGTHSQPAINLLEFSHAVNKDAPGGGKAWPVLDYSGSTSSTGSTVWVGILVELRTAIRMDEADAVKSFDVGRFGGEHTQKGTEVLNNYRTRRSLVHHKDLERRQTSANIMGATEGDPLPPVPEKARLRRSSKLEVG